tara:strand:+ start:738 stop:1265 length:528 start_codon:yes stop_codon:yes gene_type:complete
MGFLEASSSFFKRAFDFQGRSSRSEFWYAQLFIILCSFLIGIIEVSFFYDFDRLLYDPEYGGSEILSNLWALIVFLPGISLSFRRLHDIGKSGFWAFLPLAGFFPAILTIYDEAWLGVAMLLVIALYILVIVWFCMPGHSENKYGANPLNSSSVLTDDESVLTDIDSPVQRIRRD